MPSREASHNIFNPEVDRLEQQNITLGSTPVSHELVSEATLGTGSSTGEEFYNVLMPYRQQKVRNAAIKVRYPNIYPFLVVNKYTITEPIWSTVYKLAAIDFCVVKQKCRH